jgi:hypothetical protein
VLTETRNYLVVLWVNNTTGRPLQKKNQKAYISITWPALWPGGQDSWLLDMRSRFRFPVLPWEFCLIGDDPHGGLGLGSLQTLGLRPLLSPQAHIYHHSHHWGNVTAPHGRPNLRSRLHFGHNQEGGTTKSLYGHVVALGINIYISIT